MEGTAELLMALETGQCVQFRHKTPPSIESGHEMHLQMGCEQDLARNRVEGLALGNLGCFSHQGGSGIAQQAVKTFSRYM